MARKHTFKLLIAADNEYMAVAGHFHRLLLDNRLPGPVGSAAYTLARKKLWNRAVRLVRNGPQTP
jgi:hypothetical protein